MKEKLHIYDIKSNTTTNKIALTVVIMEYLVFKINADFPGGAIKKALKQLCKYKTDEEAQKLGFKRIFIPKNNIDGWEFPKGIEVVGVSSVKEAIQKAF